MQIKDRNYTRDSSEYYTTYKNAIRYHNLAIRSDVSLKDPVLRIINILNSTRV
jgi:hypothetical protein